MEHEHSARATETFLDDLQADVESAGRLVEAIYGDARQIDRIVSDHLRQAEFLGRLMRRIQDLRMCVRSQRATLQTLRNHVRDARRLSRSVMEGT
jgi:predicted RNase H-like nuclease (RuvC/YqgF family)